MSEVTTTLVVSFDSAGGGGILVAEIDSRTTGLNNGLTSFNTGDTAYYLLFATSDVSGITQTASYGSPTNAGAGSIVTTEVLNFVNTNSAAPSKPIQGGFSSQWLGKSLGAVSHTEAGITSANAGVGALEVTYTSNFTAYGIASPVTLGGRTDFPIIVFIQGTVA